MKKPRTRFVRYVVAAAVAVTAAGAFADARLDRAPQIAVEKPVFTVRG